jgi:hypothetical protein
VRMSTLERYAAAVGTDITWKVRPHRTTSQDNADDDSS